MKDINLLLSNGVNIEKSLEILGDMEMYNETLIDFHNAVKEKIANILKYKELADLANYAILVHSLKSDARYLGFETLAEIAYEHELKAKESNLSYVYENFDALMQEANRVSTLVTKYISGESLAKESTGKKILLIADDSNLIRNFSKKIFDEEYEVITAEDGKQVLDYIATANEGQIACLLLDLNMPVCDGFGVLNFFKENNLFPKIPVSIITGDDSKDTIARAFGYGIVDMLSKPFSEGEARRIVDKTVSSKTY